MDFFAIIRFMILIIIITVAWFVGRMTVLPAIKIFPSMPPEPIIRGVYTVVLEATKAIFHYILIFLLIMYIIYCIIRKFVPRYILFIPLRQPLLDLTPLYELRVSGIFPLMDRLAGILLNSMPFSHRIYGAFMAVGKFLQSSVGYIFRELSPFQQKINQSVSGASSSSSSRPPPARAQSRQDALKNKRDPNAEEANLENEGGSEPIYKANYTERQNQYVEKEYRQCVESQYTEVKPGMSTIDRLLANINNNRVAITCNVEKLKHYTRLQ